MLQSKFHLDASLDAVFIDAWSQQPWNVDDASQQVAFQRETEKLWNFAINNDVFEFKTVEDVLEENQELKDEVRWLNDIIIHNITELKNSNVELKNALDVLSKKETNDVFQLRRDIEAKASPIGTIAAWSPFPDRNTPNPVTIPDGKC